MEAVIEIGAVEHEHPPDRRAVLAECRAEAVEQCRIGENVIRLALADRVVHFVRPIGGVQRHDDATRGETGVLQEEELGP